MSNKGGQDKMFEILCVVGFLFIPLVILIGVIRNKYKDIFNPIQKDNSDYRFIEVDNVKTRSIFKGMK